MTFQETKLVLFSADLAGYARATAHMEALAVATFLDDWYRRCGDVIARRGGRIIKFMGDGCFATFPEDRCVDAVDAAIDLGRATLPLAVGVGTKLHLGVVAAGEVGPDGDRRYDVFGSAVNHLFRMGGAGLVLISEPVYRQLPNERRGAWEKNKPPATYSLVQR
jgi:adenylate cyclase